MSIYNVQRKIPSSPALQVCPFFWPLQIPQCTVPRWQLPFFFLEIMFFIFFPLGLILIKYICIYVERERETADKCISKSNASHLKIEIEIVLNLQVFKLFIVKSSCY